jgi:hypothetical protein
MERASKNFDLMMDYFFPSWREDAQRYREELKEGWQQMSDFWSEE